MNPLNIIKVQNYCLRFMRENIMKINMICSDRMKNIISELLSSRNIIDVEQAEICIVESGYPPPDKKVSILFQPENLFLLIELLNKLIKTSEDNSKIIGKKDEDDSYNVIPFNQIYYFEGKGNNTYCIAAEGEYRVKEKLYELEARLPRDRFIRVGKSFIVNILNVKEIIPWFGRRQVLRFVNFKREIEVSKNYVKSFKEFLGM